ncbi:MAG: DUF3224 domain-containing protein, partial [Nocardioides sp.]|nr:DUF3224 domain-containing protein [Nocardioides sp.]
DTSYSRKATGRFTISGWKEQAYVDIDGAGMTMGDAYIPTRGLTDATTTYTYTGEIEGTATSRMLAAYAPGQPATFEGYAQFTGSIAGQDGSCVWRFQGTYAEADGVRQHLTIAPGLGTGGLEGLSGEADLALGTETPEGGYELVLAYDIG